MKRIDDKIKEIEKKDKMNRILYIAFVVLIGSFMAYSFFAEKRNKDQNSAISKLEVESSTYYKELEKELDNKIKLVDSLNNSLRPDEYWADTKKENTVEGYIAFITNKWSINTKDYVPMAIEKLKSSVPEPVGFRGWLYVGSKSSDGIYKPKDNLIEVVYRRNGEFDTNSQPQIGDIVKLITTSNRNTYTNKSTKSGKIEQGWRNKTKAFVVNTYQVPNKTDFHIEIRYY